MNNFNTLDSNSFWTIVNSNRFAKTSLNTKENTPKISPTIPDINK